MEDQYLHSLHSFQQGVSVKVKIVRIWESIDPSQLDKLLSHDFLAIDAQEYHLYHTQLNIVLLQYNSITIEALLGSIDAPLESSIGACKGAPTPLESSIEAPKGPLGASLGELNVPLGSPEHRCSPFLRSWGVPIDFNGALKSMTTLEKVHLQNLTNDVKRRDLYIEDLSGNTLKVVYRGDQAEAIDGDRYCKQFIVKDGIVQMGLVAFGRPVKKLVGATITKLATLQPIRRMTRPRPLKALISQKKIFTVDLTNKGIRMGIANYIMFDSADLDNRQWHTAIFANASRSSTPLTSIEELEEHVLPSPVKSQI
ncbi:Uncharacterized protein TCM_039554 [Theobroma cacao]|uniref:Uncharacterized protein n=1 Tax=Theobroma cacao TaxID=3641 RepID=A0A061GSE2_THECC|nr:Uncharacterized protein TCM_039554 [Theobroma cacao]